VQQSRPAQAPVRTQESRTQTPQVRSSQPSRSEVSTPARTQSRESTPQVKTDAPSRSSAPATQSRTNSTPSRSSGRGN
jgi:hypothetical protein